jgi:hypothetical protein
MKKRVAIPLAIFIGLVFWIIVLGIIGSRMDPPQPRQQAEQAVTANKSVQMPEPEPQPPQPAMPETPQQVAYELIDPAQTGIDEHDIIYMVVSRDPAHIGVIKRFALRVVVYQRLTKAQLMRLAEALYREAQEVTPFNALGIYFYDYPQFIDVETRLGSVQYAPNGRWTDAGTVQTGDYSTMKAIDYLFEPDWTNAVTEQEAIIYSNYIVLERQYSEVEARELEAGISTGLSPMERAMPDIARQYNMSQDDVWNLLMKVGKGYEKKP